MSSMFNTNQSLPLNESEGVSESMSTLIPKMAFLLLFAVSGLIGNSLLTLVLLRGKKSILHAMIVNLCIVCLCESWMNMSIMLVTVYSGDWILGSTMCKVNSFTRSVVVMEITMTMLSVSFERFVSMKHVTSSNNYFTVRRMFLILFYTWVHSLVFSVPLLTSAIPTKFAKNLQLCDLSYSAPFAYICLAAVVCFIIPIIIMFFLNAFIVKYLLRIKLENKTTENENQFTKDSTSITDREVVSSRYSILLFIAWLLLIAPHILATIARQFQYGDSPTITEIQSIVVWPVDFVLVYLRFAFSALVPVITFVLFNNLWQDLKDIILYRRSNSIGDVLHSKKPQNLKRQKGRGLVIRDSVSSPTDQFFNVPVLFATSDGLHIETNHNDSTAKHSEDKVYHVEIPPKPRSSSNVEIPFGRACDVGPLEYCLHDTSDYDSSSEVDAFSSSQPVSAKEVTQEVPARRSLSQPEVHKSQTPSIKNQAFAADSGLDLSVGGTRRSPKGKSDDPDHRVTKVEALTPSLADAELIEAQYLESFKSRNLKDGEVETEEEEFLSVSQRAKLKENQERGFPMLNVGKTDLSKGRDRLKERTVKRAKKPGTASSPSESLASRPPKYPNYISLAGNPKQKPTQSQVEKESDIELINLGETFNVFSSGNSSTCRATSGSGTKSSAKAKGHQRHDTAESEKALLGSGSSCELSSLKSESFPSRTDKGWVSPSFKDSDDKF